MAVLVEFRAVTYQIGSREILHGIDLCVEEGETVALLGRSGSGETNLLKMVNRLGGPTGVGGGEGCGSRDRRQARQRGAPDSSAAAYGIRDPGGRAFPARDRG